MRKLLYADPGPPQSDARPISPENQSWVVKLKDSAGSTARVRPQTVPREIDDS